MEYKKALSLCFVRLPRDRGENPNLTDVLLARENIWLPVLMAHFKTRRIRALEPQKISQDDFLVG